MISSDEAYSLILSHSSPLGISKVRTNSPSYCVNTSLLFADRDYPPAHRVMMDGIAISKQAVEEKFTIFICSGLQKAGTPPLQLPSSAHCIEVMTGATLPLGTSTVIPYEDVKNIGNGRFCLTSTIIKNGQFVHLAGSDCKKDAPILPPLKSLDAAKWASIAAIGITEVQTYKTPKIAIISSGDELVSLEDKPLPYQLRRSNIYGILASLLFHRFAEVVISHIKDDPQDIYQNLEALLKTNDIILISGGVSKGKFDFIPEVLSDLTVKTIFHGVAQKPGKPLFFGIGAKRQLVFALPGNPNSSLVCYQRYVRPALQKILGIDPQAKQKYAKLNVDYKTKEDKTLFIPVKTEYRNNGVCYAHPINTQNSGHFLAFSESDGFIELPANRKFYEKDSAYKIFSWVD